MVVSSNLVKLSPSRFINLDHVVSIDFTELDPAKGRKARVLFAVSTGHGMYRAAPAGVDEHYLSLEGDEADALHTALG